MTWPNQDNKEYLLKNLKELMGAKVVGYGVTEEDADYGVMYPFLVFDNGLALFIQSDAEGNSGGWPAIELKKEESQ